MALPPETNEAFFREVDEEMRREQMIGVWRRWGKLIVAAVVLLIVVAGGWMYWHTHKQNVAGARGETFDAAIDALGREKPDEAAKPLAELAKTDTVGYRAMAKFTQADILLQKDDLKGAAKLFAEIAADDSLPKPYRDLATVRQTAAEFDTLKPDAVIQRLRALANKESPWFGSAGEMVAIAYIRADRPDLAGKMFGDIAASESVPASIRQRAVQMAGVLGVDAAKQDDAATPDGAAATKDKTAG